MKILPASEKFQDFDELVGLDVLDIIYDTIINYKSYEDEWSRDLVVLVCNLFGPNKKMFAPRTGSPNSFLKKLPTSIVKKKQTMKK